ncbi:MAG: TldD/PmbA family protein [Candidatus Aminicenantes bacterium]|jgi:PmbA protein
MNYKQLAERIVKKAKKMGADEAEAYIENNREFDLRVRNGDVETIKQSTSKGVGLTVFKDKKLGFSYTSDFSEESLDEFIKKTVQLTMVADPKPWNGLPELDQGKLKDLDLYDPSITEISNDKKISIAKEVEKIALATDKRITKSYGGSFGDEEGEIFIVNSKGVSRSYKSSGVSFSASVIAGEGDQMQSGGWSSSKRHFKDLDAIESVAKEAGKRAVEKLGAKPVETQKAPVFYDRYASGAFWYGILRAMNGDSVYKKTTFLTEHLNKPVASPLVTVVDNPLIPRHVSSTPIDGEGKIARKNVLFDKGKLMMFIYDTITARKAGVKVNTITQRGSYRSTPYASFLNIIVQNGSTSPEKILSGIKNGFYVTGLRGLGTDMSTGNYSVGASGFWIKDGEISFPVDGVTLGGNVLDMLKNIELLADDLDIRGGLNSPSFLISEMAIGGKK